MTHSASIFPLSALAVCGILLLGKPTPRDIQPPVTVSSTVAASAYADADNVKSSTIAGTAVTPEQLETETSIFDNKNHSAPVMSAPAGSTPVMTRLKPTLSLLTHPIATQTARISYQVIGSWRAQDIFRDISVYPPTLRTSQCHSACFPGIT